jgi:hypothetical protein
MASTVFVNGVTLTDADWFNDVNRLVYTILGDVADMAALKVLLLAAPGAIGGVTPSTGAFTTISASGAVTLSTTLAVTGNTTLSGHVILDGASKQIQNIDGVVGTPSYSFSGDTNTGLYRIGADSIGVSLGGSLKFSWGSDGYIHTGPSLTATLGKHEIQSSGSSGSSIYTIDITNTHGSDPAEVRINHATTTNDGVHRFLFCSDTTTRFGVRTNGGIENFSANNVNLSDEKTKNITGPLEKQRDKFKQLAVVKGGYKDSEDQNIAFLTAQNVQLVYPECVSWFNEEENLLGVREHGIWMRHLAVTQEHEEAIQKLEQEIELLKLKNKP